VKTPDEKLKVAIVSPSRDSEYSEFAIRCGETWEELSDYLEGMLDDHYLGCGWSGDLTIKVKFSEMTPAQYEALVDGEEV
jgi:hypothetical protein